MLDEEFMQREYDRRQIAMLRRAAVEDYEQLDAADVSLASHISGYIQARAKPYGSSLRGLIARHNL